MRGFATSELKDSISAQGVKFNSILIYSTVSDADLIQGPSAPKSASEFTKLASLLGCDDPGCLQIPRALNFASNRFKAEVD